MNHHPYTLLRIKRKRTDEPLDVLVFDESRVRRKKSRRGLGVFQYAQTVENDAWENEQRRQELQDEISRLARESETPKTELAPVSPTTNRRRSGDESSRRYTIVEGDSLEPSSSDLSNVVSSQGDTSPLSNKASDFRMYDAIPSHEAPPPEQELDPEMEKFLPMLNAYLKINDNDLYPTPPPTSVVPVKPTATEFATTASTDDYVWDVFYHSPRAPPEWAEAANVGTLNDKSRTGDVHCITDPYGSVSGSEEEDAADEDSNAEEYYKNDYPDEEEESSSEGGSDEFHEHSEEDEDESMYYGEEDDDAGSDW